MAITVRFVPANPAQKKGPEFPPSPRGVLEMPRVASGARSLEVDSQSELHIARRIGRSRDLSEGGRAGQAVAEPAGLEMIQHVGDLEEHGGAHAFLVDADVLNDVHIQVPGGKSALRSESSKLLPHRQYSGKCRSQ